MSSNQERNKKVGLLYICLIFSRKIQLDTKARRSNSTALSKLCRTWVSLPMSFRPKESLAKRTGYQTTLTRPRSVPNSNLKTPHSEAIKIRKNPPNPSRQLSGSVAQQKKRSVFVSFVVK
jgi:hypothetical protein